MTRCAVCDLQQDFFNCLCSLVDSSSDDDGDNLVDAAKSVVLNGQFHVVVCSQFSCFPYLSIRLGLIFLHSFCCLTSPILFVLGSFLFFSTSALTLLGKRKRTSGL